MLQQRVIFVDDGSPAVTLTYEHELCRAKPETFFCTETSGRERGYTWAVEKGMHHVASKGHVESSAIVLLNSDTIVTDGWLTSMYDTLISKKDLMIVGPLSNAAVWQSVPTLDITDNAVPLGLGIDTIAREVRQYAKKKDLPPVSIAIINGFCFMFKRQVLTHIKGFDTEHFGPGYGEEVDFCLRTRKKGFDAQIVPNSYIFHTKTASFQSDEKKELNRKAHIILDSKYKSLLDDFKVSRLSARKKLTQIAKHVGVVYEKFTQRLQELQAPSMLFVVPNDYSAKDFVTILRLVFYYRAYGVDVRVEAIDWQQGSVTSVAELLAVQFPDLSLADRMAVVAVRAVEFSRSSTDSASKVNQQRALRLRADIVLAVSTAAIPAVQRICAVNPQSQPALVITDPEDSYQTVVNALSTKNISTVQSSSPLLSSLSTSFHVTSKSLPYNLRDGDVTPSPEDVEKPLKVTALLSLVDREVYNISPLEWKLKSSKHLSRGDKFNILVNVDSTDVPGVLPHEPFIGMKKLLDKFSKHLTVTVVFLSNGDSSKHEELIARIVQQPISFYHANFSLPLNELADLYRRSDVFLDTSGLRKGFREQLWLEVMSCGCIVALPPTPASFPERQHPLCPVRDREQKADDCFTVDMTDPSSVYDQISSLMESHVARKKLAVKGVDRAYTYPQEGAALSFLEDVSTKKPPVILFGLDSSTFLSLFFAAVIVVLVVLGIIYLRPANNPTKK
mmetsp:Transcript_37350/g.69580  ORF Transcript_37350/g.69580 Transcript_37350/m.69580 type:complete len:731 (-) Transcript_37350:271-2463(-)